jgi:hypothetical protein
MLGGLQRGDVMLVKIVAMQLVMGLLLGTLLYLGIVSESVPRQPPTIPSARDR